MLALLKRLRKDIKGNILVMVAGGTAGMIGSAGIAVDAVQWYLWKRQMQQTVDSGSMAGAYSLYRGDDWESGAKRAMDKATNSDYTIERLVNPPEVGDWAGDDSAVEIVATTSKILPFSAVFMSTPATIRVRSVAVTIGEGEHCIISLKKTGVGVKVSGTAQVNLGCGVAANSKSSTAIKLDGDSYLKASPISSHGGIDYEAKNIDSTTAMFPYGNTVKDPIASRGLTVPSAPCDFTNQNVLPSANRTYDSSLKSNGIINFCGGLDIKGTVTLKPGIYMISNGDLKVNSGAEITGNGVTIILTGTNAAKMADVDISGTATVNLTATDNDASNWDGILFYQNQIGSTHVSTINGSAGMTMNGIVYMPNGDVQFNGAANQKAECLLLVASTVDMGGEADFDYDSSKCPFDPDGIDNAAKVIRIVE